jgi:hypothetical protein
MRPDFRDVKRWCFEAVWYLIVLGGPLVLGLIVRSQRKHEAAKREAEQSTPPDDH